MRRGIAATLMLAATFLGGVAEAHVTSIPSRVRHTSTAFEGDTVVKLGGVVTSKRDACEGGRTVVVYAGSDRFGSTTTAANGSWEIEGERPDGRRYSFTVYPKRIGPDDHSHLCNRHILYKVIEAPE